MIVVVAILWLALVSVASSRAISCAPCRPSKRSAWALADLPEPIRLPPHPELDGDPPIKHQPDTLSPGYRYSTEFDFNLEFVDEFLAMVVEDDRKQKQAGAAVAVQHDPERIDLGSIQDIFTLPDDQLPMYGFPTEQEADDDLLRRLDGILSRTTPPSSNVAVVRRHEQESIGSSTDESTGADSNPAPSESCIVPIEIPQKSATNAPEPIFAPEPISTSCPDADPLSRSSIVEHSPPPVSASPPAAPEIRPQEAECRDQAASHCPPVESCQDDPPPEPIISAQIVQPTTSQQVIQESSLPTATIAHHQADFDNDTMPSYLDDDESECVGGRDTESFASGSQLGYGTFSTQSSAQPTALPSSSIMPVPKPASRSKQVSFDDQKPPAVIRNPASTSSQSQSQQPTVVRNPASTSSQSQSQQPIVIKNAASTSSPSHLQQRDGSLGGSIANPYQVALPDSNQTAGSNQQPPANVHPVDVPPQQNYGHATNNNVVAATFVPANGMPIQSSMLVLMPATPENIRLATGQLPEPAYHRQPPPALPPPFLDYEHDPRAMGRTPSNVDQRLPQTSYHHQPPSPTIAPSYPGYERDSLGVSRTQSARLPQTAYHNLPPPTMPPSYPEYEHDPRGVSRTRSERRQGSTYHNQMPPSYRDDPWAVNRTPSNVDQRHPQSAYPHQRSPVMFPTYSDDPQAATRTPSNLDQRHPQTAYPNQPSPAMPPTYPDPRAATRTPSNVDKRPHALPSQAPRHSSAAGNSGIVLSEYGWSTPIHNPRAVLHNPRDQFTNSELNSLARLGDVSAANRGVSPASQSFRQEHWDYGLTEYIDDPIEITGSASIHEPQAAVAERLPSFQFDVPRQRSSQVHQSPAPIGQSERQFGLARSATTAAYRTRAERNDKIIKPVPKDIDKDLLFDPDEDGIAGKSKKKTAMKKFFNMFASSSKSKKDTKDGKCKDKIDKHGMSKR